MIRYIAQLGGSRGVLQANGRFIWVELPPAPPANLSTVRVLGPDLRSWSTCGPDSGALRTLGPDTRPAQTAGPDTNPARILGPDSRPWQTE